MSEQVIVTRDAAVCEVRLNRPGKRNALTLEMYGALADALASFEADERLRVLLLSGEGACFTAGNDLRDFLSGPPLDAPDHPTVRFVRALAGLTKAAVAAVHGPTVGLGVTLLLHCDLVVAAERSTRLIAPFVTLGLVPEAASTLLLPALMGHQRAAEMLLLGEPFDAEAARQWGLVNRVVADESLMEEARTLARALACRPPEALRATKRLLRRGRTHDVSGRMDEELREFAVRVKSGEFEAAARAFFEKRR